MNIVKQHVTTLKGLEFTPEEARLIMKVVGSTSSLDRCGYMCPDESLKVSDMYAKWFEYVKEEGHTENTL